MHRLVVVNSTPDTALMPCLMAGCSEPIPLPLPGPARHALPPTVQVTEASYWSCILAYHVAIGRTNRVTHTTNQVVVIHALFAAP